MNIVAKVLKGFAVLWFNLAVLFIGACLIRIWINEGFSKVQEIMSPYNVINFVVVLVTLLPGLGAYWLAEKIEQKV